MKNFKFLSFLGIFSLILMGLNFGCAGNQAAGGETTEMEAETTDESVTDPKGTRMDMDTETQEMGEMEEAEEVDTPEAMEDTEEFSEPALEGEEDMGEGMDEGMDDFGDMDEDTEMEDEL